MPLLTFTTMKEKLLEEIKMQTIRKNYPYYEMQWKNGGRTCHNWWRSPRQRHRDKRVYKIGIAHWSEFFGSYGSRFTVEIAQLDGFMALEDLIEWLGKEHRMSESEVIEHYWAVIRWDRWVFGPHDHPDIKSLGGTLLDFDRKE